MAIAIGLIMNSHKDFVFGWIRMKKFNEKGLANSSWVCYYNNNKEVTAHKVVSLPDWFL